MDMTHIIGMLTAGADAARAATDGLLDAHDMADMEARASDGLVQAEAELLAARAEARIENVPEAVLAVDAGLAAIRLGLSPAAANVTTVAAFAWAAGITEEAFVEVGELSPQIARAVEEARAAASWPYLLAQSWKTA